MSKNVLDAVIDVKTLKLKITCYLSATILVLTGPFKLHKECEYLNDKNNIVTTTADKTYPTSSKSTVNSIMNETTVVQDDSNIAEKEVSMEEKVNYILEHYDLTLEQFEVIVAVVLAESKGAGTCYEDAYAVISTIYNRTLSKKWNDTVEQCMGDGTGSNLYYQVITPGQFSTYADEKYLEFLGVTNGNGYQAIIDLLYTEQPVHSFLSFRASDQKADNRTQFISGGNWYFSELETEDRIDGCVKCLEYNNYNR